MIITSLGRFRPFVGSFAHVTLALGLVTTANMGCGGGNSDASGDANVAHTVTGPDGSVLETSCSLEPADTPEFACGVIDGLLYYAFFDGCNWCACGPYGVLCTLVGCRETRAFKPTDCVRTYFGVSSNVLTDGETWVCDAEGRLFRSACAPEVVVTSLP